MTCGFMDGFSMEMVLLSKSCNSISLPPKNPDSGLYIESWRMSLKTTLHENTLRTIYPLNNLEGLLI